MHHNVDKCCSPVRIRQLKDQAQLYIDDKAHDHAADQCHRSSDRNTQDHLICILMFVTSVVILVTRPAVLNLSILEKEKVCMFRYILSRRLQANPVDALAAFLPA